MTTCWIVSNETCVRLDETKLKMSKSSGSYVHSCVGEIFSISIQGTTVGLSVNPRTLIAELGEALGSADGLTEGLVEGIALGSVDGLPLGEADGPTLGELLGTALGNPLGFELGTPLGAALGMLLGDPLGA